MLNVTESRRGPFAGIVGARAISTTLGPSSEFADHCTALADCGTREGEGTTACSPTSGRFDERAQIQCGWEEIR